MGLMDFVRGQFIEVIEWTDSSADTIVYRFPVQNKEIKMGAKLTVRESQEAVFVNEGQLADVFGPGLYDLNTQNMPILTKLKSWKYGFNSPFKAEVYYVNTRQFVDQKWGTQDPLMVKDPEFGQMEVRARGTYSFRVIDSAKFMREIFGTNARYSTEDITGQLREYIVQYLKDTIAESKLSIFELQGNLIEFSDLIKSNIKGKFDQYGLEMVDLVISGVTLPEELQEAYRKGSQINLMGGMDAYSKISALDAMKAAAENQGGGFAGMGVGLGAGAAIGNMMGQVFNNQGQNAPANQGNVAQGKVNCPNCNASINEGVKFCPSCGNSMGPKMSVCVKCNAQIPQGSKFCPECGSPQEIQCKNCNAKLAEGAKFCPQCGTKS